MSRTIPRHASMPAHCRLAETLQEDQYSTVERRCMVGGIAVMVVRVEPISDSLVEPVVGDDTFLAFGPVEYAADCRYKRD